MDLTPLLPIRAVTLEFAFGAAARLRFFHQPAAGALVRGLMDGALTDEPRVWIAAPESGRVPFARGDGYRLQVFACAGAEELLERLLGRLRRLPEGLGEAAGALSLGPNLRFRGVTDGFTGERVAGIGDLFAYDAAALAREVGFYREQPPARLRFLAPARLLRPKEDRAGHKGEGRFVHDRGELGGPRFGARLSDTLLSLLTAVGARTPPRRDSGLRVRDDDIGWYDAAYYDADGAEKPMGGIVGTLILELRDPEVLPALVLGQYLGIGQRRTFGWGRYRLERADGKGTLPPRRPSRGLLARAAEPANLELAYAAIRANARQRPGGGWRDDDPEDAVAALAWVRHPEPVDALLDRIATDLRDASYRPETLRGYVLRRAGKAPRPLAVPPFADRVAQRALLQVLQTDCEPLFSAASYGYRRGRSRQDARDRLQSLYRQGYEWLYEADIDDFFDAVSHRRLGTRLRSLLPDEPAVDLLLAWIAAPVEFQGRRVERTAGLPQGAPISPLLANLLLDDFDADLEALGFQLVRFADDLVVACRSRDRAEAAAHRVRASLAEIDLRLNEDKTRITRFDDGFHFLGYTFLGDLAVDSSQRRQAEGSGVLRLEDLPPASWLAHLAREDPQVLAAPLPAPHTKGGDAPQAPDPGLRAPLGSDEPCTLLVATEGSLLSTTKGRLRVALPDGQVHEQPWTSLGAVLMLGYQKFTTPTLTAALRAQVPIHFAERGGRYLGVLAGAQPGAPGHALWLRQQQSFAADAMGLTLARELVAARIRNQTQVLRQRARSYPALDEPLAALKALDGHWVQARDYAELNGIEGRAAGHFFRGIALSLPEEFGFEQRRRRPPPDPFNALLSLGYTLLYQRTDTVLRAAGLLPWQGFYHQGRGRHAALASDLMEPFRHLVERQALAMCSRGELKPGDFLIEAGACRLSRRALRTYLTALSGRFLAPLEDAASGERGCLHQHLWRMARALVAGLQRQEITFTAFRIK